MMMLFQLLDGEDYDLTEIAKRIIHWHLRGTLYIGSVQEAERKDLPIALNLLMEHMPLVAISPPLDSVKCTFLHNDLETAMFQAVQHLHMLGHTNCKVLLVSPEYMPLLGLVSFSHRTGIVCPRNCSQKRCREFRDSPSILWLRSALTLSFICSGIPAAAVSGRGEKGKTWMLAKPACWQKE